MKKLSVIQKYVIANSGIDAMKKERNIKPDACWLDEEWKKGEINKKDSSFAIIDQKYV